MPEAMPVPCAGCRARGSLRCPSLPSHRSKTLLIVSLLEPLPAMSQYRSHSEFVRPSYRKSLEEKTDDVAAGASTLSVARFGLHYTQGRRSQSHFYTSA
ncbi:unnamed protein product [Aureobasidium pullulans]|nr:hypothetical protein D6C93_10394 [Aureobasidium pullulans]CAD0028966.1 unnamed protein product [Aureobasidium pullulans]CAD0053171.1 unnamed protein product [Aureobasidium pullulans]